MKITKDGETTLVEDSPFIFWAFYLVFVVGGIAVLYGVFRLSEERTHLVLGVLVGLGNILGGLHMLRKEPASVVKANHHDYSVSVRRWGFFGRSAKNYAAEQIDRAKVEVSEHTDGGNVYRPVFVLADGKSLPISCFWYQSKIRSQIVVEELNMVLGRGGRTSG